MVADAMRIEEAASRLGVSSITVRRAVKRGELPVIRLGKLILISRPAFDDMIKNAGKQTAGAEGA